MIIAAAQTIPFDEDVEANLNAHYKFVELAARHHVQLLIFPELSLTGYLRENALNFAFTETDARLSTLRDLAVVNKMIIVVGAPLILISGLHIASFVLYPDNTLEFYTKQHLHNGEEEFFVSGTEYNPQIALEDELFSLAICADISNPSHPENASKSKSTAYLASILYSKKGIDQGIVLLQKYAKRYQLNVLLSNYGGPSWGLEAGGMSSLIDNKGLMKASIQTAGESLLIAVKEEDDWIAQVITLQY
jgi:predicted amidohydrolase